MGDRIREDYRSITGPEKASILLMSLGEDQAAKLLGVEVSRLLHANRKRYPGISANAKLLCNHVLDVAVALNVHSSGHGGRLGGEEARDAHRGGHRAR